MLSRHLLMLSRRVRSTSTAFIPVLEKKQDNLPPLPMDLKPDKCYFYTPVDGTTSTTSSSILHNDDVDACPENSNQEKENNAACLEVNLEEETREIIFQKCKDQVKEKLSMIRWTEYSYYGKHLVWSGGLSSDNIFTVLSYNVLSQTLLEQHRELYRHHDKQALKWERRSRQLLEEFREFDADVLCLQEVEDSHLESFYERNLNNMGYKGVYKKRTNDKFDGCAIYFKTDKFDLIETHQIQFYRPYIKILDRDNIGLIVKLRLKQQPDKQVVIGTTHLLYNPKRGDIKLAQTQLFLAELERVAYLKYNDLLARNEYLPVILTGDMNYTPDFAIYELITQSFLQYEARSKKVLKFNDDGWSLNKTLIPRHVGVTDSCQLVSSLASRKPHERNEQFESGSLNHYLNLESVYDHVKNGLPEVTTNHDMWLTVDYIFYSSDIWPDGNTRDDGKLKLVSRLTLPTDDEACQHLRYIPNFGCGSDHLPLLATFSLES